MIGEQLSNDAVSRFEIQAGFEAILVFRPWVCRQSRELRRKDEEEAQLACPPQSLPESLVGEGRAKRRSDKWNRKWIHFFLGSLFIADFLHLTSCGRQSQDNISWFDMSKYQTYKCIHLLIYLIPHISQGI